MEREGFRGYVASLEQILENTYFDLKEAMDQFQDLCHRVSPEGIVPLETITDIRQIYKEIQDHLTKINGIRQLLEGKYRQHYRRDWSRERQITEFSFLAKSLHLKLESTFQEIEAKRRLRDRDERLRVRVQRLPFPWFQSMENQVALLRNLHSLYKLDYTTRSDSDCTQRREVTQNGLRSVSLFILSGEAALIDNLQSDMRLREHDIEERYTKEEIRGALTHLRAISLSEVGRVIRRFTGRTESMKLKCLLFSIHSQKDLEKGILASPRNILQEIAEGEVKALSI